jgi:hypothetical protein
MPTRAVRATASAGHASVPVAHSLPTSVTRYLSGNTALAKPSWQMASHSDLFAKFDNEVLCLCPVAKCISGSAFLWFAGRSLKAV